MKIDKKTIEVQGSLGIKSHEATISKEDMYKMWDMLQNQYKNNIGSIVREITSNCFDAHTELGVEDAVRVKFSRDESGFYVSFIDVGIGLSENRMDTIYRNYLKSTKEQSDDFIGAWGVGSKSPMSYQDMFYINTRYDGVEYRYMMRKGETSPVVDLLDSFDTSERNGTEVKLYIKSEPDLLKFLNECFYQLHYFTNVVFDVNDIIEYYNNDMYKSLTGAVVRAAKLLNEDYNLIEGEHFIIRTNSIYKELHLSIGNVRYPIDWANLGIPLIRANVALKFDIGELPVIQTREDIRYTDKAILTIKNKIKLLEEELIEKYNTHSDDEFENLEEFNVYFQYNNSYHVVFSLDNWEYKLNITNIISELNRLKPKQIKGFPYKFTSLDQNEKFVTLLNGRLTGYNNRFNNFTPLVNFTVEKTFKTNGNIHSTNVIKGLNKGSLDQSSFIRLLSMENTYKNIFFTKEKKYSVKKNKYIFEKLFPDFNYDETYIISNPRVKVSKNLYKGLKKEYEQLGIKDKDFRAVLEYFLKSLRDKFKDMIIDYDSIKVDEKWWKDYQSKNKKTADYDRARLAIDTLRRYTTIEYERKDYRPTLSEYLEEQGPRIRILFDKSREDLNKYMSKANDPITKFETLLLTNNILFNRKCTKSQFILQSTSTRNYEKILKNRKENSNIYTLNEFMSNKKIQLKLLGKVATLSKIKSFIGENPVFKIYSYEETSRIIKELFNKQLHNDFVEIFGNINIVNSSLNDYIEDFDEIDKVADLYDQDLITKFNKLYEFILENNIHILDNNIKELLHFAVSYKPKSSYFRLRTELEKKNISKDEVLGSHNIKYDILTEEEKSAEIERLRRGNMDSKYNFKYAYRVYNTILLYKYLKQDIQTQLKTK